MPRPNDPAPVSGPGKLSRRTDGGPGGDLASLSDPGVQYGDISTIRQGLQAAPLSASPGDTGGRSPSPPAGAGGPLPSHVFDSPSNRPFEDVTAGLDQPMAPPQDDRQAVALYLASAYDNPDAKQILTDIRNRTSIQANGQNPDAEAAAGLPLSDTSGGADLSGDSGDVGYAGDLPGAGGVSGSGAGGPLLPPDALTSPEPATPALDASGQPLGPDGMPVDASETA